MISPHAKTEMLIRGPVADVFDAFVQPSKLEQFWLDRASAPLAQGARVEWTFMVPGAQDTIHVTELEPNRLIAFEWSDGVAVRMTFSAHDGRSTHVVVTASGFGGDDPAAAAVDATEGFAIVLCDLKTGRAAGLVRDKAALIAARMSKG